MVLTDKRKKIKCRMGRIALIGSVIGVALLLYFHSGKGLSITTGRFKGIPTVAVHYKTFVKASNSSGCSAVENTSFYVIG